MTSLNAFESVPRNTTNLPQQPATILTVEDEQDLLDTLLEELTDQGYNARGATSAEEAWDLIQASPPDLVLCDIRLPGEDGLALMKRVRASSDHAATIPFIFLTAFGSREDVLRGKTLGADDYLPKPVDFEVLATYLSQRLGQMDRLKHHLSRQVALAEQRAALLSEARGELIRLAERRVRPAATALLGYAETLAAEAIAPASNDVQRRYLHALREAARTVIERLPEMGALSSASDVDPGGDPGGETDTVCDLAGVLRARLAAAPTALAAARVETHGLTDAPEIAADASRAGGAVDQLLGAVGLMVSREAQLTAAAAEENGVLRVSLVADPVDPAVAREAADLLGTNDDGGGVLKSSPAAISLFAAAAAFGLQGVELRADVTDTAENAQLRLSLTAPKAA